MKSKNIALYLYFLVLLFIATFFFLGQDKLMYEVKLLAIPLILVYYIQNINYKVEKEKYFVFLLCFIGDIYNLLGFSAFEMGPMVAFFIVYLLLLYMVLNDFKRVKLLKINIFPIILTFLLISGLLLTVFNLNLEKINDVIGVYILYGVVLGLLSFFSITNYISTSNFAFLNLLLMVICFMVGDFFYFINHFYLPQNIFVLLENMAQVTAYFFMVKYFIENKKNIDTDCQKQNPNLD